MNEIEVWPEVCARSSVICQFASHHRRSATYHYDPSSPYHASCTLALESTTFEYALDATEQLRADALAAFEGWERWTAVQRHDLPSDHVVDRQGFHDRVRSSSYLPQNGPAHDAMHADLDRLYEERAVDGRVRMALTTTVVVASFE